MSQFTEFELDLRRAVAIAITDKGQPSAVELVMEALIKIEKRITEVEHEKT